MLWEWIGGLLRHLGFEVTKENNALKLSGAGPKKSLTSLARQTQGHVIERLVTSLVTQQPGLSL